MDLTKADIDHVLKLAHLEVTEEEKNSYLTQLQHVLDHMERLNRLDLSDVEPSLWVTEEGTPYREDTVVSFDKTAIEKNAPEWESAGFKVPKILAKESS